MEGAQGSRRVSPSRRDIRVILLILVVLGAFSGAGLAYFNKGLYLLPAKMCDGTLDRDTVKQVLPRARSADTGSSDRSAEHGRTFSCYVTTSNHSSLSGGAQVQSTSREKWIESYRGSRGSGEIIRVTSGDIQAVAQMDSSAGTSSVYIPCALPGVPSADASQSYAVVGEARVYGRAKASGVPLRQALTDFAYQLTRHAYELAECKNHRAFPEKLPRYRER
ncbi:hypothetical protein ACWEL8_01890 [Streptomyces sp. NPDC004690]|nr:hypothetical protein [Streptomyces sp. SID9944]